jgi:hypothetical protein
MKIDGYTLSEFEDMIPYERDVFMIMHDQYLKELEQKT